jgi:putative glycosyltransferase
VKLSVVSTLYRSAGTVDEFYRRMIAAAEAIAGDIEIVLVNDGSPDDSLERALALHRADPRVVVVDLARNSGHHKAMMTGLRHARGDLVFLLDSDLEEEPELLQAFYERFGKGDCDVVYGVQEARKGGFIERSTGWLFFSLIDLLSDQPFPRNVVTARLMSRDYVQALVRHRDREFLIAHPWHQSGFRQVPITIRKLSLSPTTYSLRRRLGMGVRYIATGSTKLLYLTFYTGLAILAFSGFVILYFVSRYFFSGVGIGGWTSLIVSVWFFGGLTTAILGLLGIYLGTILSETKRRPYTIIRRVYRAEPAANVIPVPLGGRGEAGRVR